jgi:long-chain fatty acid transport protein
MTRCLYTVGVILLLLSYSCSSALALTNEGVFSQFQFNFITPGARATAMGGAFIGLADDATAAATNPAGLTALAAPEISAEFKYIAYTMEQIFENPYSDTDIRRMKFEDSVNSAPFVSVVYPFERFVCSLYRQEVVNYQNSYRTSAYPIWYPEGGGFLYPVDASVALTVTNYGVGAAFQLLKNFSVAISPKWSTMDMNSHSARFRAEYEDEIISPTVFSDDTWVANESVIDDSDDGFSVNAGIKWEPHKNLSIGLVYRSGSEFRVKEKHGRGVIPQGLDPEINPNFADVAEFTLNVPDSFGAGLAFRPNDVLTFSLDIAYIKYEDLLKDFDIMYYTDSLTSDNFTVDNATELHVGVEYILAFDNRIVTLRAGGYTDPDHTIRFTGTTGEVERDSKIKLLFPGGDDQFHVTGGLGIVFNEHLQVDAAADIADNIQQVSVSAVYRF